jgi:hypothetical protein
MTALETNRDLYLAVADLVTNQRGTERTLEEYLRALLGIGESYRDRKSLLPSEFLGMIIAAFTVEPIPTESSWFLPTSEERAGYDAWRGTLVAQIVDLIEMRQRGTLEDEQRYFGVNAPRGGRWYNFDPCTYLECAMAGTLGGWEPDDETGRQLVPGKVAVLDPSTGNIESVDPEDIEEPTIRLTELSWDLLVDFLHAGQTYE